MKSDSTTVGTRRAWEPPTVIKLAIGTETKSPLNNERRVGGESAGPRQNRLAQPGAPASKLGFSFEMAFPLSSRVEG